MINNIIEFPGADRELRKRLADLLAEQIKKKSSKKKIVKKKQSNCC